MNETLPPLPMCFATLHHDDGYFTMPERDKKMGQVCRTNAYTAQQMQAYARAAIQALATVPEGISSDQENAMLETGLIDVPFGMTAGQAARTVAKAMLSAAPQPTKQVAQQETYEELVNALHAIDTAAVRLPGFEVKHEGGLQAVVQNIVDAINRQVLQQEPAQDEPVRYEFRWTNPGENKGVSDEELAWKVVEPGWGETVEQKCKALSSYTYNGKLCYEVRALYTRPQANKPMTVEQIVAINERFYNIALRDYDADILVARAIESHHGIKEQP